MPTLLKDQPANLQPYLFHGVDLHWHEHDKNAVGDCPWCGREGKFGVELETGLWRCFVCGEGTEKGGGNVYTFLRKLWELSDKATSQYHELAENRSLLTPDVLMRWGVCTSILTQDWLVPGYSSDGKLQQLYRYLSINGKNRLLPTPQLGHRIHGHYNPKKPIVCICEGPWDAIALEEILGQCKENDGTLSKTSNANLSLLNKCSVLAVPGCSTFPESWLPMFGGKTVWLLYDSDHPHKLPGKPLPCPPAGDFNMRRVGGLLLGSKAPPEAIEYLKWGEGGYDPTLPSGFDVRDFLSRGTGGGESETSSGSRLACRIERLSSLLGKLSPLPSEEIKRKARATKSSNSKKEGSEATTPCKSYKELITAWRKALKWTPGLDHALAAMLACCSSTRLIGDQLWIKVIGPAACGKSTLCEAVSMNRNHVVAKSTIRGFHSGFSTEGAGSDEDNSLIAQLYDKTLVTKDGDTLLQSPNLPQILSEARDLYDCCSRTSYRNKMSKDYEGVRMTWILCGTSSLRAIDSSELGERFLDCVIMHGIDDDLEDEVLSRIAHRADRNMCIETGGEGGQQYEPELLKAMQMTGGYVDYLCANAADLMSGIDNPDESKHLCTRLGKFTAHMRARPSKMQSENAEREFASRLVSQLIRLAKCLALVLNKKTVDAEVMARVKQVALDTSRGQTLDIVDRLWENPEGLENRTIAIYTNNPEEKSRMLLRFLKMIAVVEPFIPETDGKKGKQKWRLTQRMKRLYREINKIPTAS